MSPRKLEARQCAELLSLAERDGANAFADRWYRSVDLFQSAFAANERRADVSVSRASLGPKARENRGPGTRVPGFTSYWRLRLNPCAARVLTTAPGSKHTLDRNSKEFTIICKTVTPWLHSGPTVPSAACRRGLVFPTSNRIKAARR